jgi:hypothetical protein
MRGKCQRIKERYFTHFTCVLRVACSYSFFDDIPNKSVINTARGPLHVINTLNCGGGSAIGQDQGPTGVPFLEQKGPDLGRGVQRQVQVEI